MTDDKWNLHWEDEFQSRFVNFIKKAPIVVNIFLKIQNDRKGVVVKHINSGLCYFFPFNYNKTVKDSISEIKKTISKHYPRIVEDVFVEHELTPEELALKLEKGVDTKKLRKYEMKKLGSRFFIVDKVLIWKSIFILKLESSSFEDDKIGECWRYKYQDSPVIFLKNYRSNKWGSIEGASSHFFERSLIIDKLRTSEKD